MPFSTMGGKNVLQYIITARNETGNEFRKMHNDVKTMDQNVTGASKNMQTLGQHTRNTVNELNKMGAGNQHMQNLAKHTDAAHQKVGLLQKGINTVHGTLSKFTGLTGIFASLFAGFSIWDLTQKAINADKEWRRFFGNQHIDFAKQTDLVKAQKKEITDLSNKWGFYVKDTRDAMQLFIQRGNDYATALEKTRMSAMLAAATGKDLAETANIMATAENGRLRTLTLITGIKAEEITKDGKHLDMQKLKVALEKKYGDTMKYHQDSQEAALIRAQNNWNKIKSSIASLTVGPMKQLSDTLTYVAKTFQGLDKDTQKMVGTVALLGMGFMTLAPFLEPLLTMSGSILKVFAVELPTAIGHLVSTGILRGGTHKVVQQVTVQGVGAAAAHGGFQQMVDYAVLGASGATVADVGGRGAAGARRVHQATALGSRFANSPRILRLLQFLGLAEVGTGALSGLGTLGFGTLGAAATTVGAAAAVGGGAGLGANYMQEHGMLPSWLKGVMGFSPFGMMMQPLQMGMKGITNLISGKDPLEPYKEMFKDPIASLEKWGWGPGVFAAQFIKRMGWDEIGRDLAVKLEGVGKIIWNWASGIPEWLGDVWGKMVGGAKWAWDTIVRDTQPVRDAWAELTVAGQDLYGALSLVWIDLRDAFEPVRVELGSAWQEIGMAWNTVSQELGAAFNEIKEALKPLWEALFPPKKEDSLVDQLGKPETKENLTMFQQIVRDVVWVIVQLARNLTWVASGIRQMMPYISAAAHLFAAILIPIIRGVGWAIRQLALGIADAIEFIRDLHKNFVDAWNKIKNFTKAGVDATVSFFKNLPGRVGGALSSLWGIITSPFRKALDWVGSKVKWARDTVVGTFWNLVNGARDAWNSVYDRVKNPLNKIINLINTLRRALGMGAAAGGGGVGGGLSAFAGGDILAAGGSYVPEGLSPTTLMPLNPQEFMTIPMTDPGIRRNLIQMLYDEYQTGAAGGCTTCGPMAAAGESTIWGNVKNYGSQIINYAKDWTDTWLKNHGLGGIDPLANQAKYLAFKSFVSSLFGNFHYDFYYGSMRPDWMVQLHGGGNCVDLTEYLLNIAKRFDIKGGIMKHGYWGATRHVWADFPVLGEMDPVAFIQRHNWKGRPGGNPGGGGFFQGVWNALSQNPVSSAVNSVVGFLRSLSAGPGPRSSYTPTTFMSAAAGPGPTTGSSQVNVFQVHVHFEEPVYGLPDFDKAVMKTVDKAVRSVNLV